MPSRERVHRWLAISARFSAVGMFIVLSVSAGCVTNGVEMPRGKASVARSTQKGSVAFASARCFLYRRDDSKQRSVLQAWDEALESDRAGREPGGFRCGRPVRSGPPPLLARTLVLGETFGFSRDTAGKIVAIAGDERIPLEEGRYAWELIPLEYTQEQATVQLIFLLFAAGFRGPII